MFKYPLVVTIDTNIFDAAKYNLSDASTLRILENHVKSGKIKVVLSDIVVQESKRHIAARVKEVCGIVNIARNSALKVYNEHLISSIGMNEMFIPILSAMVVQKIVDKKPYTIPIVAISLFLAFIVATLCLYTQ